VDLDAQLARQLDLAEKTAESNAAMGAGFQAMAATQAVMMEQLKSHGETISAHTAQLKARGELWSETITLVSDKKLLAGFIVGALLALLVTGPFVLGVLGPTLAGFNMVPS